MSPSFLPPFLSFLSSMFFFSPFHFALLFFLVHTFIEHLYGPQTEISTRERSIITHKELMVYAVKKLESVENVREGSTESKYFKQALKDE